MAYLAWCVLVIMACFLVGVIVNVTEHECIEAKVSKETLRR